MIGPDQTADPGASGAWRTFAGRTFRSLGSFTTTASALIVQLGNNSAVAGKTVVADAVYLHLSTAVSQTAYDAAGRATSATDALENVTSFEYDEAGRQTKITQPDPDGAGPLSAPETEQVYNEHGQFYQTIDPLDRATTYEYEGLGRVSKVTEPDPDGAGSQLAPWMVYTYDPLGRVLTKADRLGHTTTYVYNDRGRLTSERDAEDATTEFTYDAVGNRLTLTDPEENTTTWEYDALDRVIEETNELSDSRYFTYNAGGSLTRQVDRLGRVRQFQYDHLARNTAEIWYADTTHADADQDRQRTFEFTYDAAGQLLTAEDADASYTYTYDALGNAVTIVETIDGLTPAVTFTQQFDAAGHRTQLGAKVNGTNDFVNDYIYDTLGRATRIEQHGVTGGKAVAPKRVDFGYDAGGRTTDLTRYANLAGTQLVADSDYGYDFAGRLTDLTHFRGGTTFADYDWAFDAAGRMTQFVSSVDGTANYTNDDTGQLTSADYDYQTDKSYVYDSNGNRTNNGYTVGANNRMTSDGTYAYLYDAEGNRTRRFVDANANGLLDSGDTDITEYAWDHRNRLTTVTHRASYGAAADWVVTYAYDYANRWVRKELDSDGDSTAEFRQIFAYDGNQIVLDFYREGLADLAIGHLRERYLWGPAVDQILAEEAVDGGTADMILWTFTDHLNTVRDLAQYDPGTDTTTVVNHLVYDAFGRVKAETNSAVDSLFLFTARPFDAHSRLQNNLDRWYDATTGRWITEDPLEFAAGPHNLSQYAGNSPTTSTDPSGLQAYEPTGSSPSDSLENAVGISLALMYARRVLLGIQPGGDILNELENDLWKQYGIPGVGAVIESNQAVQGKANAMMSSVKQRIIGSPKGAFSFSGRDTLIFPPGTAFAWIMNKSKLRYSVSGEVTDSCFKGTITFTLEDEIDANGFLETYRKGGFNRDVPILVKVANLIEGGMDLVGDEYAFANFDVIYSWSTNWCIQW